MKIRKLMAEENGLKTLRKFNVNSGGLQPFVLGKTVRSSTFRRVLKYQLVECVMNQYLIVIKKGEWTYSTLLSP